MTTTVRRFLPLLVLSLTLAACSSSGGSGSGSSGSGSSGGGPTTTTMSAAAARQAITSAYSTLFALNNPAVAPKLAVVQDGSQLKAAMMKELKSALAKRAGGAKVLAVKVEHGAACQSEALPSPCAAVTYDILSPTHTVLLANSKGFAVYQAPHWLVSKTTICTLLSLANGNSAPQGC